MAAIYTPKIKIVSVTKVSTPEWDKKNGGYGDCEVVAEVRFNLPIDLENEETLKEVAIESAQKLEHALS